MIRRNSEILEELEEYEWMNELGKKKISLRENLKIRLRFDSFNFIFSFFFSSFFARHFSHIFLILHWPVFFILNFIVPSCLIFSFLLFILDFSIECLIPLIFLIFPPVFKFLLRRLKLMVSELSNRILSIHQYYFH